MPDPIAQGEIKDSFTLIFSVIAERKVKISAIRKTADMSDYVASSPNRLKLLEYLFPPQ